MRIHLIGVAGTGMGALAGLLRAAGHEVSGSDVAFDPPIGPALARWGVQCRTGFDPAHLEPRPDLVIIGNVCRADNPLARAAIDRGIRFTDMAHAVAEYGLSGTSPLVVAGTHGKTTTTAMTAWLLDQAGRSPGFLLGGVPKNFAESFRLAPAARRLPRAGTDGAAAGQRKTPFVIEGDEYDSAFFEKTPKFWHYRPEVAIVTSIEHDHIDIYPTEEAYRDAFRRFLSLVPETGLIVAAADDPTVVALVREHARSSVTWYALADDDTGDVNAEWLAAPANETVSVQTFDLYVGGTSAKRFALPAAGRHNLRNAVAAIAAAAQGFGVALSDLRAPLTGFLGVARRQDLLGTPGGVFLYDDFAHHPRAVRETLRALARRHQGARLLAIFEPRSATACRSLHQGAYAESFDAATEVILAPAGRRVVGNGEDALDLPRLARDIHKRGPGARAAADHDEILAFVRTWGRPGDVVVCLSNGAFGSVPQRLLEIMNGNHE